MLPFGKQQEILTFLSTTNPEEIWLDKASATRQYTGAGCAISRETLCSVVGDPAEEIVPNPGPTVASGLLNCGVRSNPHPSDLKDEMEFE